MPDREQVIKRLSHLERYGAFGEDWKKALRDAIALLREQEPVKPNKPGTAYKTVWSCGVCSHPLTTNWVACPCCGRKVEWDKEVSGDD